MNHDIPWPSMAGSRGMRRTLVLAGSLALLGCMMAAMLSAAFGASESQWLGMELEPLSPGIRAGLGLPADQPGVYVSDAVGIAVQSGVREGDVIVAVNGSPVRDMASLRQARQRLEPSATVVLGINRLGNVLTVELGNSPVAVAAVVSPQQPVLTPAVAPWPPAAPASKWGARCRVEFGADVVALSGSAAAAMGLQAPTRGALITAISPGLAAQAGLQRGDVILHVNGFDVLEVDQFWSTLSSQPVGSTVTLDVFRSGRVLQTSLVVGGAGYAQPAAWVRPCPLR